MAVVKWKVNCQQMKIVFDFWHKLIYFLGTYSLIWSSEVSIYCRQTMNYSPSKQWTTNQFWTSIASTYSQTCLEKPMWWQATLCFKATWSALLMVVYNICYLRFKATCLLWPLSLCKRGGFSRQVWLYVCKNLSLPIQAFWHKRFCMLYQFRSGHSLEHLKQ